MSFNFFKLFFITLLVISSVFGVYAQSDNSLRGEKSPENDPAERHQRNDCQKPH